MNDVTRNKAVTQAAFPEQVLPILVPVNEAQMEYRRSRGAKEAAEGYFFPGPGRSVSVRLISERLESLTLAENRNAFEAKYGFSISDSVLKNAFFSLRLAEALAGPDPKRGVQDALRYYRGSPPSELFAEESPVSRAIQQEPLRTVLELLNTHLERARPVMWWSIEIQKPALGLFCPDAESAVFALALRGSGLPGGLGVCQRCGNPFLRAKRTHTYCSQRCQLAARMQRYRARHAKARRNRNQKKALRKKIHRSSKR